MGRVRGHIRIWTSLGPYGGPMGGGLSHERGAPVLEALSQSTLG